MVGYEFSLVYYSGFFSVGCSSGESSFVVSGGFCGVLLFDGGYLDGACGEGCGCCGYGEDWADDGDSQDGSVGEDGVHGGLCYGLCEFDGLHLAVVLVFDGCCFFLLLFFEFFGSG